MNHIATHSLESNQLDQRPCFAPSRRYEASSATHHESVDDLLHEVAPPFIHLQLQLIVQRYQSRAGWAFYHDVKTGKRCQIVCHNTPNAELDIAYQAYLESQDFLSDMTTSAGLRALTLEDQSVIYAQCLRSGSPSEVATSTAQATPAQQLSGQPSPDLPDGAQGQPPDYILIWQPIPLSTTAQNQLEQYILALQQHLELEQHCQRQTTEIRLLEQVFQRIGHQLRHPLALLRLYTDNLYRMAVSEATQAQAGQMKGFLQELGDRLTHLIHYAQGGQLQLDSYDLAAIWSASVQELQPLMVNKQLRVDCLTTPIHLPIDPHQFRHVLDNILHNAICFSPVGGLITCRWQLFQREALITIADQGAGLSATDLEQMFRPFYTQREEGTGLGLAIAQKIVLDHGGNLWAENLPTGGTQISITLPRYAT